MGWKTIRRVTTNLADFFSQGNTSQNAEKILSKSAGEAAVICNCVDLVSSLSSDFVLMGWKTVRRVTTNLADFFSHGNSSQNAEKILSKSAGEAAVICNCTRDDLSRCMSLYSGGLGISWFIGSNASPSDIFFYQHLQQNE